MRFECEKVVALKKSQDFFSFLILFSIFVFPPAFFLSFFDDRWCWSNGRQNDSINLATNKKEEDAFP